MTGATTATYIAIAAVAVSAAGVGASVMASQAQADAQKGQMNYEAAVARNNSILAQNAAADATARGQVAEQQQAAAGAQLIGKEKATLAQSGVDVNSGSALDITTDTAGENKLDQLTILSNAQREAIGYTNNANNFNSQAALDTASADNASNFGAGVGTALSGAGSVAQKWYNYSSQGGSANNASTLVNQNPTGSWAPEDL